MTLDCTQLDREDGLARYRSAFALPAGKLYLNGNSLGPLTHESRNRVERCLRIEWGEDLISSWNRHAWIDLPIKVGTRIAPLLGAAPDQVICCDSISVNLFKLLTVALALNAPRQKIVSTRDNFPTDLYVGQGLEQLLGSSRCQLRTVAESELMAALDDSVAALLLSHVNFRSGALLDMAALTRKAHEHGVLVIWDLAHSAGVFPLALDDIQVDFAVGCGYKFLNGGPGSPAFLYANARHHGAMLQPILGWMGHAKPFEFSERYQAADGMRHWLTGTPPILSLIALDGALEVFRDVPISAVREKAVALGEFFMERVRARAELESLHLESPAESSQRGAQLAFSHPKAYSICRALAEEGIITDFRSPDLIRFGFSPLFLRFADLEAAVDNLARVVREGRHDEPRFQQRERVT